MGQKSADLRNGKVSRLLFELALPTVTSQIVNMLYNMVDRVYIGHISGAGRAALTGVGVCLPIIMLISAFSSLTGAGGAPRASIEEGRGNPEKSEQIMGNCFVMLVSAALVLTVVFGLFNRPILMAVGASEDTIGYATDYMGIYALGTLFVQLTLGMNVFITAQGFSKVSMRTVLIGAGLNTVLDPIFIFGLNMGVQGAALATVISQAVSAAWVMCFLFGKKTKWRLQWKHMRLRLQVALPCVALGLAPFVMQSTESLIAVCFNTSLLKYGGNLAVGAMTVMNSIMQMAMLPLQGLTQGAQPILSYNYGAGLPQRVRDAFRVLLRVCVGYSFGLWLLVQLFPSAFIRLFTPDLALVEYTVPALRVYMAMTCIFGIQIACQQTFIALGNAKTSLFLAVLRKIILLVPLIYLLPNFFADKVFAVFLAEPLADTLAVCTTAGMFAFQFKRSMAKLEAPPETGGE